MATISLDYDGTFSLDPIAWNAFIALFKKRGHTIYVVTARTTEDYDTIEVKEDLEQLVDGIYFTSHKPKREFMRQQGINIDVWIDDRPESILFGNF